MENLDEFAKEFDKIFPHYTDTRYNSIKKLIDSYSSVDASILDGEMFANFVEILRPLVSVKNYKTQIPFPEDPKTVIRCCIEIKKAPINRKDIFAGLETQFKELIGQAGFQLPTVSAIFHFSHPETFPIVDINVEHSCRFLYENNKQHFHDTDAPPRLPTHGDTEDVKLEKYKRFIKFLDSVIALQKKHFSSQIDYRSLDRALMVIGDQEKKKKRSAKKTKPHQD